MGVLVASHVRHPRNPSGQLIDDDSIKINIIHILHLSMPRPKAAFNIYAIIWAKERVINLFNGLAFSWITCKRSGPLSLSLSHVMAHLDFCWPRLKSKCKVSNFQSQQTLEEWEVDWRVLFKEVNRVVIKRQQKTNAKMETTSLPHLLIYILILPAVLQVRLPIIGFEIRQIGFESISTFESITCDILRSNFRRCTTEAPSRRANPRLSYYRIQMLFRIIARL